MDISKYMPDIMKHIDPSKPCIAPDASSRVGLNVPEIVMRYGSVASKMKSIPNVGRYMIGCIREILRSYHRLYRQPTAPKHRISPQDDQDLLTLIQQLGVDEVGFTSVDASMIFSNKRILYPNAIVLLMQMNPDIIQTAPSKAAEKEIFRTYYRLNVAVNRIQTFLNQRGYNAQAGPALGGEVNYPRLAKKAGMGGFGKHGLLITPHVYGPSLRLAAVYTDIQNLPMGNPVDTDWIMGFCDRCNRCVRKCPAQAIHTQPKVGEDGGLQCIDYTRCAVPFSKDRGCTVCVKECVFFHQDYQSIYDGFHRGNGNPTR